MRQQNLGHQLHFAAPTSRGESKFSVAWGCAMLQRPTPNQVRANGIEGGERKKTWEIVGWDTRQ
jgi:hypothetical protein